jgi:hypothetical protein
MPRGALYIPFVRDICIQTKHGEWRVGWDGGEGGEGGMKNSLTAHG